jgi:hypothetical protein
MKLLVVLGLSLVSCGGSSGARSDAGGGTGGGGTGGGGAGGGGTGGGAGGGGMGVDAAPARDSGDAAPAACASLACDTLRELPMTIKETGLFPAAPDFSQHPANVRAYSPSPELWSDGMAKERFIVLPAGKKIDNSKRDEWAFPVGTLLIKTFFSDGPNNTRKPIETRFIRKTTDPFFEYQYAVYQWNDAGTDATKLDIEGEHRTPVAITIKGQTFMHVIPSQIDCGKCHEANGKVAQTFIGFDELRLANKLPGAPATQLEDFAAAGFFTTAPPATPVQVTDPDPLLQRVKTFVTGNCVHCHNGNDGIVDFRQNVFVANTVGKKADSPGTTPPANWLRVIAGNPDMSILYIQTTRKVPVGLNPMPPVGVAVAPVEPVADIKAWICKLQGGPTPPLAACR